MLLVTAITVAFAALPSNYVHQQAQSEEQQGRARLRERNVEVMGTELEVKVIGHDDVQLEQALDAAIAEIRRVEDVMTDWRPSPVTKLNDRAGEGPIEVERELAVLLQRSLEIARLTGGAFDITYAGAGKLWDFKSQRIPSAGVIEAALKNVGFERVVVDLEANTVRLPKGMRLGLGGIAKGYGVDRAMAVLLEHGIQHALVSAGGDLKVLGHKFDKLWEIAIRHPRDRERVLALLPVSNTCVVTSGDYERFFVHEGRRYHHILDPRTGSPAQGCMSATVIAQDAAFADALATAICVLGPEQGLELVEGLPATEALVVGLDGKTRASSGLQCDK